VQPDFCYGMPTHAGTRAKSTRIILRGAGTRKDTTKTRRDGPARRSYGPII
jgi:hypothetical protein